MPTVNKQRTKFTLLRSHWTQGDLVWIANATIHRRKLLANFCYFGTGITNSIVQIYPNEQKSNCIKIVLPDELIKMNSSRIVQYLELDLL